MGIETNQNVIGSPTTTDQTLHPDRLGKTPIAELPKEYTDVLKKIDSFSAEKKIPYAVIGSVGVALSSGTQFDLIRSSSEVNPSKLGTQRDIDLVILAPETMRQVMKLWVTEQTFPVEVNFPKTEEMLDFDSDNVRLRYKDLLIETKAKQLQTYQVLVPSAGASFPVLHPSVDKALMETRELVAASSHWLSKKFQARKKILASVINNSPLKFGDPDVEILSGLDKLKSLMLIKHLREILLTYAKSRYNSILVEKDNPTLRHVVKRFKNIFGN